MLKTISASAVGKIILTGEHAAVYGRPAIALPVRQVAVTVQISPLAERSGVYLRAPQIGLDSGLSALAGSHSLRAAVELILSRHDLPPAPDALIAITSTIPVAAGMGSSAALAVGLTRALLAYFGQPVNVEEVSATAFEIEKHQHGTPSGIDNSVIAHERCVYFTKDQPIEYLRPGKRMHFLIANTGVAASTKDVVAAVRDKVNQDPAQFSPIIDRLGELSQQARAALEIGNEDALGQVMNVCQFMLRELTVSSVELDRLVSSAQQAGALGAKLSGGGRGGAMITLVTPRTEKVVASALARAGAVDIILMTVDSGEE